MHKNLREFGKLFHKMKLYFHEHPLIRFSFVFLLFVGYMVFSMFHFGVKQGVAVGFLSWSFFVLCTPIADGGFLIDFPVRILTGLRMLYSEAIVWSIAISSNILFFLFNPAVYQKTTLLSIFHAILAKPFPFWIIILISALGTFFSLLFGDEVLDLFYGLKKKRLHHEKHKVKYRIIFAVGLFLLIIFIYNYVIQQLGIPIHL